MKRVLTVIGAALAALLLSASVAAPMAAANPGPGNSNQCAPGQHDQNNQDPGWKPGACDNK